MKLPGVLAGLLAAGGVGAAALLQHHLAQGTSEERVHKVVILAAGLGTRMRKAADEGVSLSEEQAKVAATGVKALIPVQFGNINVCTKSCIPRAARRIGDHLPLLSCRFVVRCNRGHSLTTFSPL